MFWEDEILVKWMQNHQGVRQNVINILIRRYKNLIYKALFRQCDGRYKREDLAQEIVLYFIQLLEEFNVNKGVPLAGFVKSKLQHRIYNHFKASVKIWTKETINEFDNEGEEGESSRIVEGAYENCSSEQIDFWVDIVNVIPEEQMEILYWRFQVDYCHNEIAIVMGISPNEVPKKLEKAYMALSFNYTFLKKHDFRVFKFLPKHKNVFFKDKSHYLKKTFHEIRMMIEKKCHIRFVDTVAEKHKLQLKKIKSMKVNRERKSMQELAKIIMKGCHITGDFPYIDKKNIKDIF